MSIGSGLFNLQKIKQGTAFLRHGLHHCKLIVTCHLHHDFHSLPIHLLLSVV